ncbi:MAG: hypothetical protein HZC17_08845, partial [Candidatus Omnitrophica bacterium]|nr:hypothetical protein [Candidatus Omnitrophota bacterium]
GNLYSALPKAGKREASWSVLKLNYREGKQLREAANTLTEEEKRDDEGQILFYERVFGGDVGEKHLGMIYSALPKAGKQEAHWSVLNLNYREVKKLREAANTLTEEEKRDDEGQIAFYERVFGDEVGEKHLGNLYSALPKAGKREASWSVLKLNYREVKQLREAANLRLEELKEGYNTREGQNQFYEEVFGNERPHEMDQTGIHSALPNVVKQAMTNWRYRPLGEVAGASLGAAEKFAGGIYPFWMYTSSLYPKAAKTVSAMGGFSVTIKTSDNFNLAAEKEYLRDKPRAVSVVLDRTGRICDNQKIGA